MAVDYQMEPQEAVIAIESDDDGTEESDAEATAAAAALDAEPPRQCLLCQLHIPRRGCTTSQSVGSVSISLGNRGRSLNIRTIPQVVVTHVIFVAVGSCWTFPGVFPMCVLVD